jgi:hypothetical protein
MMWLTLEKKFLTWDNGLKRGWDGPSHFALCRTKEELVQHLFVTFSVHTEGGI